MISTEEIEKLANLSRLALSEDEKAGLRKEFDSILGYVEQVQKISVATFSEKVTGTFRNVMREDVNPHESGIFTTELLNAAPQREGDYIKVKRILGN